MAKFVLPVCILFKRCFMTGQIKKVTKINIMLINKSIYFHKLRQKKQSEVVFTTVLPIRDAIDKLNTEIAALQKKLNKHSLPSFNSREKKFKEIETQKETINSTIGEIEQMIRAVSFAEKRMVIAIQSYFFNTLKRVILLYRTIQQESLTKCEMYNEYKADDTIYEDENLLQMTIHRTSQIRQNIFNLTNTLLELKMILKNQSMAIDRIDFFFDRSNFYLEEANREIEKMPGNFTKYKDFIIYCLIYLICILLVLVLIKIAREK